MDTSNSREKAEKNQGPLYYLGLLYPCLDLQRWMSSRFRPNPPPVFPVLSPFVSLLRPPSRYGGISVGGVNSQVRMTQAQIEVVMREVKDLFNSSQVRRGRRESAGGESGRGLNFLIRYLSTL